MSAAASLSVAVLTIFALLISAYWTNRRFANFEKLPRQYGITGEPTAFASRKAMAWGVPLFLIATLGVIAASKLLFSSGGVGGGDWANLALSSAVILAAQSLILWLHVRWAGKRQ
ncbi:hypothetical protein ACRAQ7_07710 [Erythrobacter sp. W53]|uniref:hypothetical protein n=1 Tax=Erythrobacter sp. W53 TaxID=3425947 RepID=UPI003D7681C8